MRPQGACREQTRSRDLRGQKRPKVRARDPGTHGRPPPPSTGDTAGKPTLCLPCVCFPEHRLFPVPSACPQTSPGWVPATRCPPPVLHTALWSPGPGTSGVCVTRVRCCCRAPPCPTCALWGSVPICRDPPGVLQGPRPSPLGQPTRENHSDLSGKLPAVAASHHHLFCFVLFTKEIQS